MLRGGGAAIWPAGEGFRNGWFSQMAQRVSQKRYGICNALRENLVIRLYAVFFVNISMIHCVRYTSFPENRRGSAKTVCLAEKRARLALQVTTGVIIFKSTYDTMKVAYDG